MKNLFVRYRLRKSFDRLAGQDRLIDFGEWKSALRLNESLMARRMFDMIDRDGSGYIDFDEYCAFAQTMRNGDLDDKIEFVFGCCDLDDSGRLSRTEIGRILANDLAEQGLRIDKTTLNRMVASMFKQSGIKPRSGITRRAFGHLLREQGDLERQCDAFFSSLTGIRVSRRHRDDKGPALALHLLTWLAFRAREIFWLTIYIAANAVLFQQAMATYAAQDATLAVQLARGGGACLNLNAALLLLPLCKGLWSALRHSFLGLLLPLDHLVTIHKLIAVAILGFSLEHIAAHIWNYLQTRQDLAANLLQTTVGITGLAMVAALLLIWLTSLTRNRHHRRFVVVHYLYLVFFAALVPHGPETWLWVAPGFGLYLVDRLARFALRRRRVEITSLTALSDQVTSVRFKRGQVFRFHPGDYIRVRIPVLGREWHPFTLSAAPESNRFDIHVRNRGDWSGALHNLAGQRHPERRKWRAYIDGPYASPTSSVYRSGVAVLIAGGIGVTPFASLLNSLLLSRQRGKAVNPGQVIHFHWLNRSQTSYEWFIDLLTRAEKQLGARLFHLHIHLTSLTRNLSNTVMQVALDAYWQEQRSDPITGLQARTASGRPDWNRIFGGLKSQYRGQRVDIYYCGPPGLGRQVRQLANRHGLNYRQEKFD